jgi:hypothetical protein
MKYGGSMSLSKLKSFSNYIDSLNKKGVDSSLQEPPELQIKAGQEAINIGIARAIGNNSNKFTSDQRLLISNKVADRIRAANEAGQNVTRYDIETWAQDEATKEVVVSKNVIVSNDTVKKYQVPYGFEERSDGVYDPNGHKVKYNNSNGYWELDN